MQTLLLIVWLSAPLAPLNPIERDTVALMNLHVTAGVTSPNGIVSFGPEVSAKYEVSPAYPFVLRTELDLRLGTIGTRFFPNGQSFNGMYLTGNYQAAMVGVDMLYYRGTDRLTAFLGFGVVHAFYHFSPSDESMAILRSRYNVDDIGMNSRFGYRFTLGLRFHKAYTFEIGVMQLEPEFSLGRTYGPAIHSKQDIQTQMSGFRFTLGYIWQLRDL